jgi:hypothetical protein
VGAAVFAWIVLALAVLVLAIIAFVVDVWRRGPRDRSPTDVE